MNSPIQIPLQAPASMVEQLRALADQRPDATALIAVGREGERRFSYAEIDLRVRALAAELQASLAPGDRALLVLDNDEHYVVAFFACLYAGVTAVPVFPPESVREQHLARLSGIAADCAAACVLASGTVLALLEEHRIFGGAKALAVDAVDTSRAPLWRPCAPQPEDIAFLQYTSGSTSSPKGVMVSHANLMANERAIEEAMAITREDVFVSWLPLYHDMGLIGGLLQPFHRGIPVVLMSPAFFLERPVRWLEAISAHRGTISGGPDFAFRLCLERVREAQLTNLDLSSWRVAFSGAEPVRHDTLASFIDYFAPSGFDPGAVYPCYGLAEATLLVSGGQRGAGLTACAFDSASVAAGEPRATGDGQLLVGCGAVPSGHRVAIVDPQSGDVLDGASVGEIWVAGPSIAQGYWQRPDDTASSFAVRDGARWLRTGDLGFFHRDQLYIAGRIKDVIILRGQNLYPQDIERAIEGEVEAVRKGRVAAFAVTLPQGGEGVGVAVEVSRGLQKLVPPQVLVDALSQAVSAVCREPVSVALLLQPGALPKTSSGKLQRGACRQGWMNGTLDAYAIYAHGSLQGGTGGEKPDSAALPDDETGRELAAIWQQVLPADAPLSRDTHFFVAGGNSLAAVRAAALAAQRWNIDFPARLIFEFPVLENCAEQLRGILARGGDVDAVPPLVRLPADSAEAQPLSLSQRSLWLTWALAPASPAYNLAVRLRLPADVRLAPLQAALQDLVWRHEPLRTVFVTDAGGEPAQRIAPASRFELAMVDLGAEDNVTAAAQALASAPFDLAADLPFRATLLRSAGQADLILSAHHIAADGWSLHIAIDELAAGYAAHADGKAAPLAPLPFQFADFAHWQRQQLQGALLERQIGYWRDRLGDNHEVLALPLDRQRGTSTAGVLAGVHADVWPEALSAALRQYARKEGATLYMVMLALFKTLLYRVTGQGDLRVGAPAANRQHAATHGMIAYLVSLTVLRTQIDPRQPFTHLLRQVRQAVTEAQEHSDVPFDVLVDALQPERQPGVHPLVQVKCTELPGVPRGLVIGGQPLVPEEMQAGPAHFDLSLDFTDQADGIAARWVYDATVLDASTVARLATALQNFARQLVARPETAPHALRWTGADSRLRGASEKFDAADVLTLWRRAVAQAPQRLAVRDEGQALDYALLDRQSSQLARTLRARGVGAEIRVGIHADRGCAFVLGVLAVLKAGGVYVPLDPALPAERLAWQLSDSGAALLLSAGEVAWNTTVPQLPLELDDAAGQEPASEAPPAVHAQQGAYLIYTSGSTGQPKGVLITHGALANYVQGVLGRLALPTPGAQLAMVSTVAADLGHTTFFGALCGGHTLHLISRERAFDPDNFATYMREHAIDVLKIVPSHLQALLHAAQAQDVLPRQRLVLGGEATSPALLERIRTLRPGCAVINHYGPTETTVGILTHAGADGLGGGATLPVGTPLPNSLALVLNAELNPVPVGVVGELYLGGCGVARGYSGRPGLTAERFIPDPFDAAGGRLYRTGDRVRQLPSGAIEFLGRADDQVKIRGYRVEPREVAAALATLDGVSAAEVLAVAADDGRMRLHAYVAPAADAAPDADRLLAQLKQQLPDYMVPSSVTLLAVLPLNANGKLDRRALPPPQSAQSAAFQPPQGETETTLARIWADLLGVEQITRHANFFELGGDSILSLKLMARARKAGLRLHGRQVFEHPVLSALAASIDSTTVTATPTASITARSPADSMPVSHAQDRLWFLWRLDPAGSAYHIAGTLMLRGVLEMPALRAAFDALVRRHASLRTVFEADAQGQARQRVLPALALELPLIDLSAEQEAPRDEQAMAAADRVRRQPFDLTVGPLLRVAVIRTERNAYQLVLCMHHIVSDGWSMQVLIEELVQLYRAHLAGQAAALPALPCSYADYAAWQRKWLASGEGTRQLAYWRQKLEGEQPVLQLHTDAPRAAQATAYTLAHHRVALTPGLAQNLQRAVRGHGVTPFVALLAALQVLLHRYTGQQDIRIGTPVANRHHADTGGIVGLFVNTQVLRGQVTPYATLQAMLAQAQVAVQEAQAHQDLPFEQLVEALQPDRGMDSHPLFQVMLNHQRDKLGLLASLPGLTVDGLELGEQTAQFELVVNSTEMDDGGIAIAFGYARELFAPQTIARMAGHYLVLLEILAAEPDTPVHAVPLLSEEESNRLHELSRQRSQIAAEGTLQRRIEVRAAADPAAIALTEGDTHLAYGELNARANRLAHYLIAAGVGPEQRVGLAFRRGSDLIVAMLAVLKSGAAYVPLDPDYPSERLAYIASDSGIAMALTDSGVGDETLSRTAACVAVDKLDLDCYSDANPQQRCHADNLAYVIYTSGSTGMPKGAQLTHRNVLRLLDGSEPLFQFGPLDVWTLFHSHAFDFSVWEIFGALCYGGRLVMVPFVVSRAPHDFLALLRREQVTVLNQTPSAFTQLMQAPGLYDGEMPHLRAVIFGGEALDPESLRPWIERFGDESPQLVNMYGITETTVHVTYRRITRADLGAGRSPVGAALPDLGLRVLDAQLNPVPLGVAGELYVSGAGLARGYLRRAGLTASRFVADPFSTDGGRLYRSGDLARWNVQGELEYLGRADDQVKIRGFRIELGEIEARLRAIAGVGAGLVTVHQGPGGARLLAYAAPAPGAQLDSAALKAALAKCLPDYMVPAAVLVVPAMPLNANGKIDRKALPLPEQAITRQGGEPPRREREQMLAAVWAEVLGLQGISRDDHFFEIGGHSLLAIAMTTRLRVASGVELALRKVFEYPRLADMAVHLEQVTGGGEPQLAPIPRNGPLPLSPAQQRLWLVDRMSGEAERRAYNMAATLSLDGDLDTAVLRRALQALVARHEVLRTVYRENEDGEPFAQILPPAKATLTLNETSLRPEQLAQVVQDHADTLFDLANGPLLRAKLVMLAPRRHVLLLAVHHIAFDGWSQAVFIRDFVDSYRALSGGAAAPAALDIQYADYADWHNRKLAMQAGSDRNFWRDTLAEAPPVSTLPYDVQSKEAALASTEGDALTITLDAGLTKTLAELAQAQKTSLFTVLLASFQLLLHRVSCAEDLVIGTDVAGRGHPALESLIGFFVNVVPLRSRLRQEQSFVEWLAQSHDVSQAAFSHQDLPFDQILNAAGLSRGRQRKPLVQVLFVMQNVPESRFDIPGLHIELTPQPTTQSKFHLAVFVHQGPNGLAAQWVFSSALYSREHIAQVAAQWRELLAQVAVRPSDALDSFAMTPTKDSSMNDTSHVKLGKLEKLKKLGARDGAKAAPRAAVRTSLLHPDRPFPLVVEASSDIDAVAWARTQRDFIDSALARHGGILFRNLGLDTPQQFESFAEIIEPELYGGYGDLPKKEGGRNTYRSTPYPERQMILFHNESAHLDRWPRKQWFYCEQPSPVGGATPIVDCREMLRRLPEELVREFERKGLLYVRTFTDRLDVPWREFFKTDSRADVEQRLGQAGIEWRWLPNDELQTRTRCPAVITHPVTGERVFFNQVQLHHVSCLEEEGRNDLMSLVGAERMPRQVYFGDGGIIPDETMAIIGQAYEDCAVRFDWRKGDVVMLDNMLAAHARDPFEGPRKIVVAMGAMFNRADLNTVEGESND
ncbi:amino acid adenylation domain-containing protein [Duganella sp. SG902]|uniref:non-ribosomal peptide synthetase n=1 Tax=Duganella sp. SG902 TaxID=2587016 RepID=UPI00159DAF0A|nr:non-ribosomal peptide synthetase [Duganella sp. SG902]NVM79668.1 amino acid adenylation domain-containing protein [Duganella sp. SG902]